MNYTYYLLIVITLGCVNWNNVVIIIEWLSKHMDCYIQLRTYFFNTKDIFLFQPKGVQSNHYKAWNENSSSWSF